MRAVTPVSAPSARSARMRAQRTKDRQREARTPLSSLLLLRRIGAIGRRAGARGAEEQLASVGIRDVAPVRAFQGVVTRLIAIDDDLGAHRQRVFLDTRAK